MSDSNLRDIQTSLKDMSVASAYSSIGQNSLSYKKTAKLIAALYMVTDILDQNEPIRHKLRTLGTNILSDIHSSPLQSVGKIIETLSFLEIASAMNIISPMNTSILTKEFLELRKSVEDLNYRGQISLSDMFTEEISERVKEEKKPINRLSIIRSKSIGHSRNPSKGHNSIRVGVQKAGTLLQAINNLSLSDRKSLNHKENLIFSKRQRENEIMSFMKTRVGEVTISDIKSGLKGQAASMGEKTLQRELNRLVDAGLLKKTGKKRWSKYSILV